jgi:hypothetical protein
LSANLWNGKEFRTLCRCTSRLQAWKAKPSTSSPDLLSPFCLQPKCHSGLNCEKVNR